jgi:hypothetical protein
MTSDSQSENGGVVSSTAWLDARQKERELCKRDVCMYCGGRALGYKRTPDGPNESGNWTHQYTTTMRSNDRVLCVASSIFARESFERTQASNAPGQTPGPES